MKLFPSLSLLRPLIILGALGTVTGCGMFKNVDDDYHRASSLPPMKVPEDMQTASLEPLYPVPELAIREDELLLTRDQGSYEVPRPDPLATDGATESGVKIQSLNEERWILADAPTSQIWPRVQSFLSRYGISVKVNDPTAGLIETDWVRFKVQSDEKHRYRILIEQGLRPDTTEVHVVQRQLPEAFTDVSSIEWNRQSDDAEREAFLLDELAAALARDANNSSASLLGQKVGGKAKADISFVGREPVLQLRLDYDRTWATVTHSLGQQDFMLWEADSAKGIALVGYLDESVKRPFFMRLFGSDELPKEAPASLPEVLSQLSPEREVKDLFGDVPEVDYGSPRKLPNVYLVVIKTVDGESSVRIRSAKGTKLPPRNARDMLILIRRNLI